MDKIMKNSNKDVLILALGEIIVAVLVVIGFLATGFFKWQVISGAVLGGAVTVINFLILSLAVNRALDKFMETRGEKELTEEEVEKLSKAQSIKVQNAITKSYVLRTGLMFGSLIVAFISGWFDPLATVIPLLMYKPLIYAVEFIKKKRGE